MKRAALALLALLCACARPPSQSCDIIVASDVAFSSAEAPDHVTARAIGPTCNNAVALFTINTSEDTPIWSWSSPLARAFGPQFHQADDEQVHAFLEQWVEVRSARTSSAPSWPDNSALPPGIVSPLDRVTYEDVRARDLPVLCHLVGVGRQSCLYWEPAAAEALVLFEHDDVAESPAEPAG